MLLDITITLDPQTVVLWAFVGLVAGFLASKVMLGHGMGLFADIVVGLVGAIGGGMLANYLGITLTVPGHTTISQIIVGFLGAVVLLGVFRVFQAGRHHTFAR